MSRELQSILNSIIDAERIEYDKLSAEIDRIERKEIIFSNISIMVDMKK